MQVKAHSFLIVTSHSGAFGASSFCELCVCSKTKRILKEFLQEEASLQPQLPEDGAGREEKSLGAKVDYRLIMERNAEKERQKKDREYRRYSRPISINIFSNGSIPRNFQYTPRAGLQSLRKLERLYKSDDPRIRKQMTERDAERLTGWIKDTYREGKKLEEKASQIKEITVELSAEEKISVTSKSTQKEIARLKQLHLTRKVQLKDEELLACNRWLNQLPRQRSFPDRTRSEPDKLFHVG
jgi:hypothetical protein